MASNRFSIPILSESKPAEGYSKIPVMMQKKIINLQDQGRKFRPG